MIKVTCPNGDVLQVRPDYAGKKVRCPKCSVSFTIPDSVAEDEPAAEEPAEETAAEESDQYSLQHSESDDWETEGSADGSAEEWDAGESEAEGDLDDTLRRSRSGRKSKEVGRKGQESEKRGKAEVSKSTSGANPPLPVAAIAGGAGSGLLAAIIVGWLVFGGSQGEKPQVAEVPVKPPEVPAVPIAPANPPANPAAPPGNAIAPPGVANAGNAAKPEMKAQAGAETKSDPANPSLAVIETDNRIFGFQLPSNSIAAAYDFTASQLAITHDLDANSGEILIFDVQQALQGNRIPVRKIPVEGGLPGALACKSIDAGSLYLVANNKDPKVYVYDASNGQKRAEVSVLDGPGRITYLATSTNPNSHYAYYIAEDPTGLERRAGRHVGRINLRDQKVDSRLPPERDSGIQDLAVSGDGEMVYVAGYEYVRALHWPATGVGVTPHIHQCFMNRDDQNMRARFVPDPWGQRVAVGFNLFSRHLWHMTRTSSGYNAYETRVFFRDRPLTIGFTAPDSKEGNWDLRIGSSNDERTLGVIPLPDTWFSKAATRKADPREIQNLSRAFHSHYINGFADDRLGTGLIVVNERLLLVPVQNFAKPEESVLSLGQPLPSTVTLGEEVEIRLQPPGGIAPPDYEIIPQSAKDAEDQSLGYRRSARRLSPDMSANSPRIDDRFLRWRPSVAHIGHNTIRIRATQAGVQHEWNWDVTVTTPRVAVPFEITGVRLQQDGRYAVVWGRDNPKTLPRHLSVIDLTSRRPIVARQFDKAVYQAAIDATGVYAVLTSPEGTEIRSKTGPSELVRFDAALLEPGEKLEMPIHPRQLTPIAGKYMTYLEANNSIASVEIPRLKLRKPNPLLRDGVEVSARFGKGWLWEGVVYDAALEKPEQVLIPVGLGISLSAHEYPTINGFTKLGAILMKPHGPTAATWRSPEVALPQGTERQLPNCQAEIELTQTDSASAVEVKYYDKKPAKPESSYLSADGFAGMTTQTHGSGNWNRVGGEISQDFIALIEKGELVLFPLSELKVEPRPMQFEQTQSTFNLDPNKPTKLKYHAEGAVSYELTLKFRMKSEEPAELVATSEDGEFSIDFPNAESLRRYASRFVVSESALVQIMGGRIDAKQKVNDYVKAAAPYIKEVTGKPAKGVPVPVYVSVIATGPNGEKAAQFNTYFVDFPMAEIIKVISLQNGGN